MYEHVKRAAHALAFKAYEVMPEDMTIPILTEEDKKRHQKEVMSVMSAFEEVLVPLFAQFGMATILQQADSSEIDSDLAAVIKHEAQRQGYIQGHNEAMEKIDAEIKLAYERGVHDAEQSQILYQDSLVDRKDIL